jgi:hypothetical protein
MTRTISGAADRCIFCLERPADSREHVWDAWITRHLQTIKPDISFTLTDHSRGSSKGPPQVVLRTYRSRRIEKKSRVVCDVCNNGWMSEVTNRAADELRQMIIDPPAARRITPAGLRALANLAFLKAVVLDHTGLEGSSRTPFFDGATRQVFKTSLTIPHSSQVWLATYADKTFRGTAWLDYFQLRRVRFSEFLVLTYVIGFALLQLTCSRTLKRGHGLGATPLKQHPKMDRAAIQIWPTAAVGAVWPPADVIGADTLDLFRIRWGKLKL